VALALSSASPVRMPTAVTDATDPSDQTSSTGAREERKKRGTWQTVANPRTTSGVFGAGEGARLARQMTAEIHALRDSLALGQTQALVAHRVFDHDHSPGLASAAGRRTDCRGSYWFALDLRRKRKSQWPAPCIIVCVRVSCKSGLMPSVSAKSRLQESKKPNSGTPIFL
jgi:hypothetical protein